ncbi:Glyoxylase, beta-lactamase superfamily II [Dethiosulfatibacter aminovorans DSM 17477]|uniref:Glyoxylase, beta-lactamase superfamily II n=1 Tax=Dethiosulfatibacter aminovorans DSM 17477 TaxID=1121476 RepID=A0A1M6GZP6_9FIRM|nr:MBL fold metallo-hydrolase [Dethiosulfatibacter aminovorans]SHJ15406.1 Glyoxylase, beta-lactamase superfamily II [Dethiosulfatibacter aminovorans DSM 17477]
MTKEIFKNIYLIEVPLPNNPLKNLNSYYIKGKKRNLLVDTGFNNDICYEALTEGLTEIGATMKNTDIFLTHLHSDHTGLCGRIASESSKIFIGSLDKTYLEYFCKGTYWDDTKDKFVNQGFSESEFLVNKDTNPIVKYAPPKDTLYTAVEDGHVFDLGGVRLETIFTPGHTPGHMCLYIRDKKILFSGDHIIFDITPNISPLPGITNSLGCYLKSLEKLKDLEVEHTLSSHRNAMGDDKKRINELIEHHMERLDEAYSIVENSGGLSSYEVASKMTWSVRLNDWKDFPPHQKWFAVGEAAAHLDYLQQNGKIHKYKRDNVYIYSVS